MSVNLIYVLKCFFFERVCWRNSHNHANICSTLHACHLWWLYQTIITHVVAAPTLWSRSKPRSLSGLEQTGSACLICRSASPNHSLKSSISANNCRQSRTIQNRCRVSSIQHHTVMLHSRHNLPKYYASMASLPSNCFAFFLLVSLQILQG